MKTILLALITAAFSFISSAAEPAKAEHTYTGDISGVVCVACKEHISTVLMEKLKDTVSIDVKPGAKEDGPRKLIIVSKNGTLTKDQAVDALGSLAKNYQILSLEKKS